MARLDNLAAAKAAVQLGATLGREFSYQLIEAVSPVDTATLDAHGEQLVRAELLFQRGPPPTAQNQFKHALIRDAAYQALALGLSAMLHQFLQEPATVLEQGGATVALAAEQDMPLWSAWAETACGWAMVKTGEIEDGSAQVREGLDAARRTGAEWNTTYFLALLADAELAMGHSEEALDILDEALAFADGHRERFYEAELHRLRGEILLKEEGPESTDAEACVQKALDIARGQESKSLELRATIALARLGREGGDRAAARRPLEAAYGWFTEGLETRDLQGAKVLLDEL